MEVLCELFKSFVILESLFPLSFDKQERKPLIRVGSNHTLFLILFCLIVLYESQ